MARIIAVCNQKGGVGKTTTSVNLGSYLAALGKRVLLVDFDPQANASSALGHKVLSETPGIYHAVAGIAGSAEVIKSSPVFRFHYIPAAQNLAGLLVELVAQKDREHFLRKFLLPIRHEYDYVLIDLPPSLSLLTINGMIAADEILVPVQAEYYSLEGLSQLLKTVALIRNNLRHPLKIAGAVVTMFNKRERLSREVARELKDHFPHHVYNVRIPRSVALAEAPSFARPVMLHAPDSSGARAYADLAAEVVAQEEAYKVPQHFGNFNNS